MRVLDPPILGCDRLSRCADRRWDRRLCVHRGAALARRPYTTVITVTAVGFREVGPLSELGRNFTMVLLAAGITGIGVWFALIASFIVEFDDGLLEAK